MRTDGQTDMVKLMVSYRSFATAPKYTHLKVCHPRCVRSITQSCSVYIYLYIHTVMNTTILKLVAIYNIQLHVSALYVGHHQIVQRTY